MLPYNLLQWFNHHTNLHQCLLSKYLLIHELSYPIMISDNLPCLQTSTLTLLSDYKSDSLVVIGFDSSYEVIPSELSNSEQMLLVDVIV